MTLLEHFKKQGGLQLIKELYLNGALPTAIAELLFLGKSRKALEILRLATQYKTRQKIEKRYRKVIQSFVESYEESYKHDSSDIVWFCWFQGIDNAPEIVKYCYQSLVRNLNHKRIIVVTKDNMSEYAHFPEYIIKKWHKGIISNTHMSDLLRLELLIHHGGTWIDSTVLCTQKQELIPSYYFESDLFFFQTFKPGRDGQTIPVSNWYMSAKSNNKVLEMTQYLCYEHWKTHNKVFNYYMFHFFFMIALEHNKEIWDGVIPVDNSTPHMLLLRLFEQYDTDIWNAIKGKTPFHKLTYKMGKTENNLKGTYFDVILGGFHE